MNSITNALNASLYSTGLSRGVLSSSAQGVLLGAAVQPQIPNVSFKVDGIDTPLAQILNEALSQNPEGNLVSMLSSVGSYSATDSLLSAVYGKSTSLNSLI